MALIDPDCWQPVDVDSLEDSALEVVKSQSNTLVVAGPGAGKTELLAQRACFLLETGTCLAPHRILAISFKRDAAKNLGERVRKRCGDRAQRFDSFTLDAFAKNLVDRFRSALPPEWRPRSGYEVMPLPPRVDDIKQWVDTARQALGRGPVNWATISPAKIKLGFDRTSHGFELPYDNAKEFTALLGRRWWREQLQQQPGHPSLTFPMLSRLAAFLLRQNPKVTEALRATYSFVFLDEFQDTTASQYDLIRAAFEGSRSVLTAVGDSKQRIMVWAGAKKDIFDTYKRDFDCKPYTLTRNYRSSSELVRMQHVIAQALEAGTPPATATKPNSGGSCRVLEFTGPIQEADYLGNLIHKGISTGGLSHRDYCVLVRQGTSEMIKPLEKALAQKGIRLRDESKLQDLLSEPVVKFVLAALRLGTRTRDPEAWEILTAETAYILGLSWEEHSLTIEQECQQILDQTRSRVANGDISALPSEIIEMVGEAAIKTTYRQYGRNSFLSDTLGKLVSELSSSGNAAKSPRAAVDDLIGIDIVPAMTIHKSKGLEFHTIIFLGLEDSQWWNFRNQSEEERRNFFVAFSRAIQRVYFTFSDVREERWGRRPQRKIVIGSLYRILKDAGVPTIDLRNA